MLPRRHVHPDDHLSIGIKLNHSHGLSCGDLIFIGGQADISGNAEVTCPNDLAAQTDIAMDGVLKVLEGFGADAADLVKLTAFYVLTNEDNEALILKHKHPGPVSTGIPFPYLAYRDMLIEIDCVAMV